MLIDFPVQINEETEQQQQRLKQQGKKMYTDVGEKRERAEND